MDTTTRRAAGFLLLSAAAATAMLLSFFFPNVMPWAPNAAAAAEGTADDCVVTYFALDPTDPTRPNPNKETPGAVGPAVTQRDEAGIKAELRERRSCGSDNQFDPTLTASHYSDWSAAGLTQRQVGYADIDAFAAEMVANPDLYATTLAELESLENGSSFSIGTVSKGVWSIFMMPDGNGGVITKQGQTQSAGATAVFTHPGGAVIEYRLECGFQIVNPVPFDGPEDCTTDCSPPPTCERDCDEPPCEQDCDEPPCTVRCDAKDPADDVTPPQGVVPRGVGPRTTDHASEDQHTSGDVSGNVTDDEVGSDTTSGSTTSDTGTDVGDATSGGDDHTDDVVDTSTTSQDEGGTDGATDIGGPPAD